ncbi:hypothetical protein OLMES_5267 [Oleiphilus messinensis]|uniref:Uncharacterized protein n=2 Tax=Oleiphilus messinensis TaxID=141451 RepID=A0A1Y0IG76_9GAMM|nr:hypothetical protein OLMES_5267 [Oleiphilus messinensis]
MWIHENFQKGDFLDITIGPPNILPSDVPLELSQGDKRIVHPVQVIRTEVLLNDKLLLASEFKEGFCFQAELEVFNNLCRINCFSIDGDLKVKDNLDALDLEIGDRVRFNFA